MTSYTQFDLEMAERHIVQGEQHIVQQEELLTRLRIEGLPTEEAEKLLSLYYEVQAEHHQHRHAIAAAIAGD